MTPYITDILKEINEDVSLLKTKHKDNYAVRTLLQYAYDKRLSFSLPEGEPPYKKDDAPLGMSPANFYQQVKKLYVFTRTDLNQVRKEQLFIQLLEGLHPTEASVCIALKDHALTSLYPNITVDVVVDAGIVESQHAFRVEPTKSSSAKQKTPVDTVSQSEPAEAAPKRGRGRPKKTPTP